MIGSQKFSLCTFASTTILYRRISLGQQTALSLSRLDRLKRPAIQKGGEISTESRARASATFHYTFFISIHKSYEKW